MRTFSNTFHVELFDNMSIDEAIRRSGAALSTSSMSPSRGPSPGSVSPSATARTMHCSESPVVLVQRRWGTPLRPQKSVDITTEFMRCRYDDVSVCIGQSSAVLHDSNSDHLLTVPFRCLERRVLSGDSEEVALVVGKRNIISALVRGGDTKTTAPCDELMQSVAIVTHQSGPQRIKELSQALEVAVATQHPSCNLGLTGDNSGTVPVHVEPCFSSPFQGASPTRQSMLVRIPVERITGSRDGPFTTADGAAAALASATRSLLHSSTRAAVSLFHSHSQGPSPAATDSRGSPHQEVRSWETLQPHLHPRITVQQEHHPSAPLLVSCMICGVSFDIRRRTEHLRTCGADGTSHVSRFLYNTN